MSADSCAKPNLRLTMLTGAMQNHHVFSKPAGSVSNNTPIYNDVNSLSINDNEDTENKDSHVINNFRGFNNNNLNAISNYRNNDGNDASNPQPICGNGSNYIDDYAVNAFRHFNNDRNSDSCNNQRSNENARFKKSCNQQPLRGKFHVCNSFNHHAHDCQFLKKLQSCLKYMENNNIITS